MSKHTRTLQRGVSSLGGVFVLSMMVVFIVLLTRSLVSPKQPIATEPSVPGPAPDTTPDIAATDVPSPELATAVLSLAPTEATPGGGTIVQVLDSVEIVPQKPCIPVFAPVGERYLCFVKEQQDSVGELWLGSLSGGLERVLLNENVYFRWAYDDRHIVYSPWSITYVSAPQPVFLMGLETGESKQIGQAVLGWLMRTLSTGYISFLSEDGLRIANPLLGTEALVPIGVNPEPSFPQPQPGPTLEYYEPTAWPEWLLTPSAEEVTPVPTTAVSSTPPGWAAAFPYMRVSFELSIDGQRIALVQWANGYGALSIIELQSGKTTLVSDQITFKAERPFSWSPDGKTLAYAIATEEGTFAPERWLVNADGNEPRKLWAASDGPDWLCWYDWLTWLPGRDVVIFARLGGSNAYAHAIFYTISVSGGEPRQFLADALALQFLDGGRRLVYGRANPQDPRGDKTFIATLSY